ncbi:hypothetical protein, partial [Streptomyces sp. CAI 127]|uniref:hypothetical protein n=1 Tax=Streptomyces sp. CAI 127 TaxID=1076397 RepID=UPI0020CA37B7
MRKQHGLDLTELDTETTDLDLVIRPADKLQIPVGTPPHQITRPVHPPTITERGRHKTFRRQTRAAQIPTGQHHTRHIQLTDHTINHR